MSEIIINCPLCEYPKSKLIDNREFRGQKVRNAVCANCGFVFQTPRMTAEELDEFYAREYRVIYQGEEGPTGKDLFIQTARAIHAADFVAAEVDKIDQHLDVGSSAGILLQHFRERFKCGISGVEPGEQYRKYAERTGISMYPSLEALKQAETGRFDLVSMMHVLEHLADPVQALIDLREQHLQPNGALLIEVPNLYGHDSFETAHMSAFSSHTLQQTLRKAGFEIIRQIVHGKPRSKILPLYLTVLAKPLTTPSNGPVQSEKNVHLKRRAAMLRRRILQRLMPTLAWLPVPKE